MTNLAQIENDTRKIVLEKAENLHIIPMTDKYKLYAFRSVCDRLEDIAQDIPSSIEGENNQAVRLTSNCTITSRTTSMQEVEKEEAFAGGNKGARASAVATDRNIGIATAIGCKKGLLDVIKTSDHRD